MDHGVSRERMLSVPRCEKQNCRCGAGVRHGLFVTGGEWNSIAQRILWEQDSEMNSFTRNLTVTVSVLGFSLGGFATANAEDKPLSAADAQAVKFFETRIRPLLFKHCYRCHGSKKQESGLRLDHWAGIIRGGESGPALVPGQPDESLIVVAVSYDNEELQMPPDAKLSAAQIASLKTWIERGAAHPDKTDTPQPETPSLKWEQGRRHWAFQQPVAQSPPVVRDRDWPRTAIDHFVLAALEKQGLRPAPPADRRTLIRRATLDLTGLPPTLDEISEFVSDPSPDAFGRLIDRLLDSPHYGERWARHWLDVARYADSNGLDENIAHGNAWRYRDYVVAAFNRDKTYDRFILEQLAGDALKESGSGSPSYESLIATGFLSLGPKVLAEVDETKMEMDIIDEQIDTIGRSLMGLTLGCARCHEHKFDPIGLDDYYGLAGIFKSTRTMEHFTKIARWWENPIPTAAERERQQVHRQQVQQKKAAVSALIDKANAALTPKTASGPESQEDREQRYPEPTRKQLKQLRDSLAALEKQAPQMSTAMGVMDRDVKDVRIHIRGSHLTLGRLVPRQLPRVLSSAEPAAFDAGDSGRLRLAKWLTTPEHPLTARVLVNRIWRWKFGRGIVETADNLGRLGARPSNQPLLDWLAIEFVRRGWSIKSMHRLIMSSSTYRMSSQYDSRAAKIDPENRLHWRSNVRRLEAEAIRDSLLMVGGMLDISMGGSLLHVKNREFFFDHTSKDKTVYSSPRRSVYLPVVRNHLYDVFQLFDYTDAGSPSGDRATSTVAPQALFMMNGALMLSVCESLAQRVRESATVDDAGRVQQLYQIAYGRRATEEEVLGALEFLQPSGAAATDARRHESWKLLCQVVLAANEFVYIK